MNRRDFLKKTGVASASSLLLPVGARAALPQNANVYEVYHPPMVNGTKPLKANVQEAPVQAAMDAMVKTMTGKTDVGQAWQAVFPGITAASKIAIKINALKPNNAPQFATLKAIVMGLRKMFGGTYPAANISAFDNNLWGGAKLAKAFAPKSASSLGIWAGEDSYAHPINVGGQKVYVSTHWHSANYHINLLAPRRHRYYFGNYSGFIKNMMGAVSIVTTTYKAAMGSGNQYFHAMSDPTYAAYKDLMTYIKNFNKCLYVGDMIMLPKDETCDYMEKVPCRLIMGTDPVAMEMFAIKVIKDSGITPNPSDKGVKAMATAGLGSLAYNKIDVDPTGTKVFRSQVLQAIKNMKAGTGSEAATQKVISDYLGS